MHLLLNAALALLYFGVLTPFAVLLRLMGKLPRRRLRADTSAATYWISRAGRPASRMDQQS